MMLSSVKEKLKASKLEFGLKEEVKTKETNFKLCCFKSCVADMRIIKLIEKFWEKTTLIYTRAASMRVILLRSTKAS